MKRLKIIGLGVAATLLAGALSGCAVYGPGYGYAPGYGYGYGYGYSYAPGSYYYAPAYGGVYVGDGGCCGYHHHWH